MEDKGKLLKFVNEAIGANREKIRKAIDSTYTDGRERAFYVYKKKEEISSFPIRAGAKDQVTLRIDKAWLLKRVKPDLVMWFHTHDYPYEAELSVMDEETFNQPHVDVACVGVVEEEWQPEKKKIACFMKPKKKILETLL